MCQDWTTLPTLPADFKLRGITSTTRGDGIVLRQHHLSADGMELTVTEMLHAYEIIIAGTPIPWTVHTLPESLRTHLNLGA